MSDDELEKRIAVLESRLDGVSNDVGNLEDAVGGEEYHRLREANESLKAQIDDLREQNETLRRDLAEAKEQLKTIRDLGREKTTKEEKVAAIIQYADNVRASSETRVGLKYRDVKGAAGVSNRYAYDLMDDLPSEYEFFLDRDEVSQYGDLEIDKDAQDRALIVDFERLHADEQVLNKFNNAISGTGVET